MISKRLVYITPHNWYDHVENNNINRPLKIMEHLIEKKYFLNILIVNRLKPSRVLNIKKTRRKLVYKKLFFNLYFDDIAKVYYLEHCLPFGCIEEIFLPFVIAYVSRKMGVGIYHGLLWVCDPKSAGMIRRMKNYDNLFDAYDDWSLSPLFRKRRRHLKYITNGYKIVKKYADNIIVNTNYMKKKLETSKNNVALISNTSSFSCNLMHYSSNKNIKKKIGYIGNLHERLDLALIDEMVTSFPKIKFIFIGKNQFKTNEFNKLITKHNNIILVDSIPYEKVPEYIAAFDVCIVPHVVNKYTLSQDSMKIYDYLAFGKPIVTTPVPPADHLNEIIYAAKTKTEFIEKIKLALHENDESKKIKRLIFMKNNTWSKKVASIYSMLEEK
ncbi:glycosyltransferase [Sporolactobacillus terrae]|uniref:glycosyltransferase n=1 Tax=Sporolactobacillus terrae TaxID=269673 RepID=UPI001119B536|nr:glycosyltransferase [Sporolactobacillus terrae]